MPRPRKTVDALINGPQRNHKKKADMAARAEEEKKLLTGIELQEREEVACDPVAHAEFTRVKKLFAKIGKDDDIYGAVINRYCVIYAEVTASERRKENYVRMANELSQKNVLKMKLEARVEHFEALEALEKSIAKLETQINKGRTMLIAIEKESAMTLQAALRSIPVQQSVNVKKTELLRALGGE